MEMEIYIYFYFSFDAVNNFQQMTLNTIRYRYAHLLKINGIASMRAKV